MKLVFRDSFWGVTVTRPVILSYISQHILNPPTIISPRSLSDFSILQQCHWQCNKLRAIRVSIRNLYISCSSNSSVRQKRKLDNHLPIKMISMIFEDGERGELNSKVQKV